MKHTDNACPSHAFVYRRLATSASPTHDIFSTIFSLERDSAGGQIHVKSFERFLHKPWGKELLQHIIRTMAKWFG
jgi:hypothetical protein